MKSFDVEDAMAALMEAPVNELVILLCKYSCMNNLVMHYLVQSELADWLIKYVEEGERDGNCNND